jgi:putative Holliday junction resolvase
MGRIMAVDAGERRVGVALSDESRLLASPLIVLDRGQGLAPVLDALGVIARREGVAQVVVGLPLNADGSEGRQAKRAREFARTAARVLSLPVGLWDERLSTRQAEAIVRAQGRNTKRLRQKGQIDAIAAAVILQDYLDHQPHASSVPPGSSATDGPSVTEDDSVGSGLTSVYPSAADRAEDSSVTEGPGPSIPEDDKQAVIKRESHAR